MASYPLIYMRKSRNWAHFQRQNWQTSLYFSAEQGMGVRDGFADDCPHRQEFHLFSREWATPSRFINFVTKLLHQGICKPIANLPLPNCSPDVWIRPKSGSAQVRASLPLMTLSGHRSRITLTMPPRYLHAEPHRLVTDVDATLEQNILDLPRRQRIADVHHHHEADHLGRTVEITEGIAHRPRLGMSPARLKPICSDIA